MSCKFGPDGKLYFQTMIDPVATLASEHEQLKKIYDGVREEIANDPEIRILIRECVKEVIAKMNLAEVVEAAVREVLRVQNGNDQRQLGVASPSSPGASDRRE